MKLVWAAAIMMVMLVAVGVFLQHVMSEGASHILKLVNQVEEAVLSGSFDQAEFILSQADHEWTRANKLWCMIVDHDEMDRVRDSLIRLRQHIRYRDRHMCMEELSVVKWLVEHVPKKESFSLESVL